MKAILGTLWALVMIGLAVVFVWGMTQLIWTIMEVVQNGRIY